jgi:hypothetical protein
MGSFAFLVIVRIGLRPDFGGSIASGLVGVIGSAAFVAMSDEDVVRGVR